MAPLTRRYSAQAVSPSGWDALPAAFRESWEDYVSAELSVPRDRGRGERGGSWDYTAHYGAGAGMFEHLFDDVGKSMTGTGLDDALTRYRAAITYAAFADPEPSRLTDFHQVLTLRHMTGALSKVIERQAARRRSGDPAADRKSSYGWSIAGALYLLAGSTGAADEPEL